MEIVYFANTPPTAASCHRTIIRFGFASFPFTAWFVGSSSPTLRRSKETERDGMRERGGKKGEGTRREGGEAKMWAKAKPGERQEEKRDTTNRSKAHLARATDSPRSRPCNPSNSRVRPARHSSRANPAKITVLNRDCG